MSRPKCILILIGNPKTLSLNKDFEYIIKECKLNNAFIGTDNPPQKSATDSNKKSNTKSNRMLSQLKNLDLVTPYSGQTSGKKIFVIFNVGMAKTNINFYFDQQIRIKRAKSYKVIVASGTVKIIEIIGREMMPKTTIPKVKPVSEILLIQRKINKKASFLKHD